MIANALAITAVIVAAAPSSAETKLQVRAYIDAGFAADDKKAKAAIAEASTLLSATTGVALELHDSKPWKPSPAASKNLRAGLAEIERTDAGNDVDLVLAFITSPPKASDDIHNVGSAKPLSKWAVIRKVDDAHQQAIVIAHHVLHQLGGVHPQNAAADDIAGPKLSKAETKVSDDVVALVKLGVGWNQAKSDKDRGSAVAQLKRELEARKAKLDGPSADELRARMDELAGVASADLTLPAEQARVFNDAVVAMNKGDGEGAWKKLKALADRSDAGGNVLATACRVLSMDGVDAADAQARCDKALKANPDDLDTADAAIRYALKKGDPAAIAKAFAEGKARLAKVKTGGAEVDELAALAQGAGRITLAEDALAKSTQKNVAELKQQLTLIRRRSGIPRGIVSDNDEPAVLDVLKSITANGQVHDEKEATVALENIDKAVKRFGKVPGLLIERCDIQTQKGRMRDAEAACEEAVKAYDDGSTGHVVYAIALGQDELVPKAIPHLEKAIQLDPDYEPAYIILQPMYHQVGKRDEEGKLKAAYEKKFGKPMQTH